MAKTLLLRGTPLGKRKGSQWMATFSKLLVPKGWQVEAYADDSESNDARNNHDFLERRVAWGFGTSKNSYGSTSLRASETPFATDRPVLTANWLAFLVPAASLPAIQRDVLYVLIPMLVLQ